MYQNTSKPSAMPILISFNRLWNVSIYKSQINWCFAIRRCTNQIFLLLFCTKLHETSFWRHFHPLSSLCCKKKILQQYSIFCVTVQKLEFDDIARQFPSADNDSRRRSFIEMLVSANMKWQVTHSCIHTHVVAQASRLFIQMTSFS